MRLIMTWTVTQVLLLIRVIRPMTLKNPHHQLNQLNLNERLYHGERKQRFLDLQLADSYVVGVTSTCDST